MAKVLTAPQFGEQSGLGHLEVIRRIRKGDINAKKFGWNWAIPEEELTRIKEEDWYQRAMARRQAQLNG